MLNDLIGNILADPLVAQTAAQSDQTILGANRLLGSNAGVSDSAFENILQQARIQSGPAVVADGQSQELSPELNFKIAYQQHLGKSLQAIANTEFGELSLEDQQELQGILELLGKKLLKAQEEGQIKLSASTEEQLEKIASGDITFDDIITLLSDPVAVADIQSALAKLNNEAIKAVQNNGQDDISVTEDTIDEKEQVAAKKDQAKNTVEKDTKDKPSDKVLDILANLLPVKGDGQPAVVQEFVQSLQSGSAVISPLAQSISAIVNGQQTPIASLLSAQAQKPQADVELSRYRQLVKGNVAQKAKVDGIKGNVEADGAKVKDSLFQSFSKGIQNDMVKGFGEQVKDGSFNHIQNQAIAAQASSNQAMAMQASTPQVSAQQGSSQSRHVLNQVLVHINKNAGNKNEFRIQLNPRSLGYVDVRMQIDKDGRTRAFVIAERPETLNMLQKDAGQLVKAFENAGLHADMGDLNFGLKHEADDLFKKAMSDQNNGGSDKNQGDSSIDEMYSRVPDYESVFLENKVNYTV